MNAIIKTVAAALCAVTVYASNLFAQGPVKLYPVPKMTNEVVRQQALLGAWSPQIPLAVELPASVDNSKKRYFPPVFNQIGGSCAQSSAIGYIFTYEMNRLLDRDASLESNQFSYLFVWNFLNSGIDEGGFALQGLNLARGYGIATKADFPAQAFAEQFRWMSGYDKYITAMRYRAKEVVQLASASQADIETIKRYLYDAGNGSAAGGVVSFSSYSPRDFVHVQSYSGPSSTGYRMLLTKLPTEGGHAMTIVGYDDAVEFTPPVGSPTTGAFIVVNSWGTSAHDNGRFYLPYWFFTQPRGADNLSENVVGMIPVIHEPKLVFKVKVTYSARNDLSFIMGVANKPSASSPSVTYTAPIANFHGGAYAMQGQYSGKDIELAFDFTDNLPAIASYDKPKYFINVLRATNAGSGQGKINYFSVVDYRQIPAKEYVCTAINNTELMRGNNLFAVATTPVMTTSASPLQWYDRNYAPYESPYVVRTASGKYSKIQFVNYDRRTGKVIIKYLIDPSGSRDLTTK